MRPAHTNPIAAAPPSTLLLTTLDLRRTRGPRSNALQRSENKERCPDGYNIRRRPMGGVCVVDLTSVIEESYAAHVLAGRSAVVIKIESASG
jgi:hypothetical protein